jgi:hypothetical protein
VTCNVLEVNFCATQSCVLGGRSCSLQVRWQAANGSTPTAYDVSCGAAQVPKATLQQLVAAGVTTGRSHVVGEAASADGTRKFLCQLTDGRVVEAVGIPELSSASGSKPRLTACISSQVGCPMRCTFCATGKGGFARNLRVHEIVDQVLTVQEQFGTRVTNIGSVLRCVAFCPVPSVITQRSCCVMKF